MAIEYQGEYEIYHLLTITSGEHHYQDIPSGGSGTLSIKIARDNMKQNIAKEQNIKFLAIPYWYKIYKLIAIIINNSKHDDN